MPVEELPAHGFQEALRSRGRVAVLFTADWCPHCRRFEPEFAAAESGAGLPLARADISDDEADPRWDDYAIRVVPTVIVFDQGEPVARLDAVLGQGLSPVRFRAWMQEQGRT